MYDRNLEEDLKGEEKGWLGRIFRSIASGGRPTDSNVDSGLAQKEAQELYDVSFNTLKQPDL